MSGDPPGGMICADAFGALKATAKPITTRNFLIKDMSCRGKRIARRSFFRRVFDWIETVTLKPKQVP